MSCGPLIFGQYWYTGNCEFATNVTSVANTDGLLTISPTTGNVIANVNVSALSAVLDQSLAEVLVVGQITGGTDLQVSSGDDINFLAAGGTSRLKFTDGGNQFQIYVTSLNGSIWTFEAINLPGSEFLFTNAGIGDIFQITFETTTVTIGSGLAAANYRLRFDGDANDGIIEWLEASDRFNIQDNIQISTLGTGVLHSDATGIITSSTVDISTDTNLSTVSPVLLVGDVLSFDETVNFTSGGVGEWTGEHVFNGGDITFNSAVGSGNFKYTRATGALDLTLSDDVSARGFDISKTETVRPAATPSYYDLEVSRSWSGLALIANLFNFTFNDTIDITSGVSLTRLFAMTYLRGAAADFSGIATNAVTALFLNMTDSGQYSTGGVNADMSFFQLTGNTSSVSDTAASATGLLRGIRFEAEIDIINNGAGTAQSTIEVIVSSPDFDGFAADIKIFRGTLHRPEFFQFVVATSTFVGFEFAPVIDLVFAGTLDCTAFRYNPSGGDVGSATHTAFISTLGLWKNQADDAKHSWGAGDDVSIQFTAGNIWEFTLDQTTVRIDFNPGLADTDFRISGDTDADLFFLDAGNNRVGISTNAPDTLFHVAGAGHFDSDIQLDGAINHDGTLIGFNSAVPVAQDTGWSITNVSTLRSYDASTATLQNILDTFGTLIETVLKPRGDIGA